MMFFTQSSVFTRKALTTITMLAGVALASSSHATIVEFQTTKGSFQVNLFDHDPAVKATVDNFLKYVNETESYGNYAGTIIHRSSPNFVIQGGGYYYDGEELPPKAITSGPKITNQPVYSNVRGTITMAKLGSQVNSATNQWFINLKDNSANLDLQNGGFSAFGQVIGNGMDTVVKAIADEDRFNMGSPFNEIPLVDYTATDALNNVPVDEDNFVTVTDIIIIDDSPDTAASLAPLKNTLITEKDDDSGGGSINILLLGLLSLLALGRKYRFNKG